MRLISQNETPLADLLQEQRVNFATAAVNLEFRQNQLACDAKEAIGSIQVECVDSVRAAKPQLDKLIAEINSFWLAALDIARQAAEIRKRERHGEE